MIKLHTLILTMKKIGKNVYLFLFVIYIHYVATENCIPETFLPDLENCENYFICDNGALKKLSCPYGLQWNNDLNICDWPQNVNCERKNESGCTEEQKCQHGEYYPNIENCASFFQCVHGKFKLIPCPKDLLWNDNLKICDWPQFSDCNVVTTEFVENGITTTEDHNESESTIIEENSETPEQNEFTTEGDKEIICDGKDYLPNPLDCTNFYQCAHDKPILIACPDGLHFNEKLNVCDWPENAKCILQSSTTTDENETNPESTSETEKYETTTETHKEDQTESESNSKTSELNEMSTDNEESSSFPVENETEGTINNETESNSETTKQNEYTTENNNEDGSSTYVEKEIVSTSTENINVNVCASKDYLPNPSDCSSFYQCANGKTILISCPDGLHFNEKLNVCDWPENANCITQDSTTIEENHTGSESSPETTEQNKITSESSIENPCNNKDYLPNLSDCTSFYQCLHGNPVLMSCPDGLNFNEKLNVCDWPENANCIAQGSTIPEENETSSESSSKSSEFTTEEGSEANSATAEQNESTTENHNEAESINTEENQTGSESNSETSEQNESTTENNDEKGSSTPVENETGSENNEQTESTTENNNEEGSSSLVENETGSENNEQTESTTENNNEEGSSSLVENETASENDEQTESTTENNNEEGSSTPIENETVSENIEETESTTENDSENGASVTEENETSEQNPTTTENICDNKEYLPNPSDCASFYQCSNGKPIFISCPGGLHFNEKLNVCDWPENVNCIAEGSTISEENQTNSESITETSEQIENTTPSINGNMCDTKDYFPNPLECNSFYQCTHGKPVLISCPDGLHFNDNLNVCDWPENSNCVMQSSTAPEENKNNSEPSSETTTQNESLPEDEEITESNSNVTEDNSESNESNENLCDNKDYLPNSIDCTSFFQCTNGKPILMSCPEGLHFNRILNVCDWPENANCVVKSTTTNTISDESQEKRNSEETIKEEST